MKQLLRVSFLLLALWGISLADLQQAYASHAQGGELTYEYIGTTAFPNRYRITCRFFRDCSGIAAPTSLTVNARVNGCTGTNPLNTSASLTRGVLTAGSPYCANVPGGPDQCSASGLTNYQTAFYTGTIDLPPSAEWVLSIEESARPSLANIPGNTNLRLEATLNNLITLTGGSTGTRNITNTSPQYNPQDIPIPFVCVGQRTTLTFSTFEPDGDSLVYSMEAPLDGCGDPSNYNAIGSTGGVILDPSNSPTNPCVVTLPTATGNFSAIYPILSYNFTGNCPVRTGTPFFNFDPSLGSFTFRPSQYFATPSANGDNKYAIVGKVTEYRRINGRYYKIGSVRRDMMVVIIDCGGNSVPSAPTATPVVLGNNTTIVSNDSTIIEAQACEYTEVNVTFRDPNPGDQLTVTYSLPPNVGTGATFGDLFDGNPANVFVMTNNGGTAPVARVRLRPDPLLVGNVYRIPVRIEDNACPVKAVQNRVVVIKVIRRSVADVTISGVSTPAGQITRRDSIITRGEAITLVARPNRPSVIGTNPVTYTYSWTASTPQQVSTLTTSMSTQASIEVRPTQTTRYSVRVAPSGFRAGSCVDTASFVIRVAPQVPNVFTPNGDGKNDFFVVKEASQPARSLEVYNRWGRKVKEWTNYNNDWNGEGQPDGVYYYQITMADGKKMKGWVEIVR